MRGIRILDLAPLVSLRLRKLLPFRQFPEPLLPVFYSILQLLFASLDILKCLQVLLVLQQCLLIFLIACHCLKFRIPVDDWNVQEVVKALVFLFLELILSFGFQLLVILEVLLQQHVSD